MLFLNKERDEMDIGSYSPVECFLVGFGHFDVEFGFVFFV